MDAQSAAPVSDEGFSALRVLRGCDPRQIAVRGSM